MIMDSTQSMQSPEMKRNQVLNSTLSPEVLSDLSLDGLVNKTVSPCLDQFEQQQKVLKCIIFIHSLDHLMALHAATN